MANLAPQFGRLVRHIWVAVAKNLTSSVAVGTIIALTGFGPEHWFATAFRYVEMPQVGLVWPSWLDIRALIVSIGVAIVVADVLVRRMHREKSVTAPAGAEAPLPRSDQVIRTPRSRPGEEGPAADVAARATEAATPSVAPSLPDRPSIVVLPFANMSRDLEQEYFSDGITEDIITDLSKVSGLFVIARNSAFVYKDQAVNVPQVCRDLGVRFALEGSIRKSGNRVRVTAQLIDGSTGGHLWAERYDRDLTDIFELQDDVTRQIVGALKITLTDAEKSRIVGGGTKSVEAHDLFLKGRELMFGLKKDREIFDRWMACFRRAIELDPNYSDAYAGLGMGYCLGSGLLVHSRGNINQQRGGAGNKRRTEGGSPTSRVSAIGIRRNDALSRSGYPNIRPIVGKVGTSVVVRGRRNPHDIRQRRRINQHVIAIVTR